MWHPDLTEVVIDFGPGIGIQLMMGAIDANCGIVWNGWMDGWRACHPHSHSFLVLGITVTRHCFCPILIWFVNFRSGISGSVGRGLGRFKMHFCVSNELPANESGEWEWTRGVHLVCNSGVT